MAIDEETAENGPIDLLIIRAHGNQNRITLDKDSYFWIGDHLPKNSCLNHLPPKATVVIDSCSTGKGREDHDNFANYLSEHCPSGTRIFSSTIDIHGFVIPQTDPVEIRFHLYLEAKEEYTYVIDPEHTPRTPVMTIPCLPSATEYRDQSLHSTDPKVIEIVKKTYEKVIDILPTKMEVAITDPAHLKKAAVLISHPIGEEGIKAGVSLKVNNLSHTSLQVSKELPKGTTVGLNFSPLHPKETTLSLSNRYQGTSAGIILNPLKPEQSMIHFEQKLNKVGLGYSFNLKKPLQGNVSLSVPTAIAGVPLMPELNFSLRKPLNTRLQQSLISVHGANLMKRLQKQLKS